MEKAKSKSKSKTKGQNAGEVKMSADIIEARRIARCFLLDLNHQYPQTGDVTFQGLTFYDPMHTVDWFDVLPNLDTLPNLNQATATHSYEEDESDLTSIRD